MRLSFLSLIVLLFLVGCTLVNTPTVEAPTSTATQSPLPTRTALPSPTPTPDGSVGTVIIWHSWDQVAIDRLVQVIIAYQNEVPDVQFDVLYVPEADLRSRFIQAAEAGGGPTLVLAPGSWGEGLLESDLITDLSNLLSTQTIERLSPAARQAAQIGTTWVGLPYAVQGVVLYRNREIITAAPGTFDDLISLAQAATLGEINGAILERSFFFSGAHLLGLGGEWLSPDGTPAFNTQQGRLWLSLLQRFSEVGGTTFMTDQDLAAFQAGKAGTIIDSTWNLGALEDALGPGRLVIDPWPTVPGGRMSGFIQVQCMYLANRSTSPDRAASLRVMEFILSPVAQAILADRQMIPVTLDAVPADPLIAQAAAALAGGVPYPTAPQFELYTTPIELMLQSVFDGSQASEEALRQAEAEILARLSGSPIATPTP